jgi:hypothetical protein
LINNFLTQYLPPILVAIIIMLALFLAVAFLARGGFKRAQALWRGITRQRMAIGFLCFMILVAVAISTFLVRNLTYYSDLQRARDQAVLSQGTASNLISTGHLPVAPLTHTVIPLPPPKGTAKNAAEQTRDVTALGPQQLVATNVVIVQPGDSYRLSFTAGPQSPSTALDIRLQVRELWFGPAFNLISFKDNPPWQVTTHASSGPDDSTDEFYTGVFQAPAGATRLQLEIRNTNDKGVTLSQIGLFPEGVYVEPHPNGTQGAIAFSFDWESAMGGPVHSQGMTVHDVAGATEHGLLMRQGADWLKKLFADNKVDATFYSTGYNLLDGNTQHLTFSGNPTYKWASEKNNWNSNYWLTHPWYSDDPFGTYTSDPAWYFGDQTRALLAAGHEIAPHTFGHLYVRGTTTGELGTDMDEWLNYAKAQGVPPPTTFAFPWRSSNSLTADFYNVLYQRGIRAVTRVYAPDLRDQYTLGAAPVYSYMAVMPDFLLGSASANAGEEAAGAPINLPQGLAVISETLARRGTTSFWNHPEQMGDLPDLQPVRDAWKGVVEAAAKERDAGRLWIATVGQITAFQRDVMSVTVALDKDSSGAWRMNVTNNAGHNIKGVTLTLPGDATALSSPDAEIRTVVHPTTGPVRTALSPADKPSYPARQLGISDLKPGVTTIGVQWATGQEPGQ